MADPHAICAKWVRRIGAGFHPDTRASDCRIDGKRFSMATAKEYDADMEALFAAAADPYECAVMAMADAGYC